MIVRFDVVEIVEILFSNCKKCMQCTQNLNRRLTLQKNVVREHQVKQNRTSKFEKYTEKFDNKKN